MTNSFSQCLLQLTKPVWGQLMCTPTCNMHHTRAGLHATATTEQSTTDLTDQDCNWRLLSVWLVCASTAVSTNIAHDALQLAAARNCSSSWISFRFVHFQTNNCFNAACLCVKVVGMKWMTEECDTKTDCQGCPPPLLVQILHSLANVCGGVTSFQKNLYSGGLQLHHLVLVWPRCTLKHWCCAINSFNNNWFSLSRSGAGVWIELKHMLLALHGFGDTKSGALDVHERVMQKHGPECESVVRENKCIGNNKIVRLLD